MFDLAHFPQTHLYLVRNNKANKYSFSIWIIVYKG